MDNISRPLFKTGQSYNECSPFSLGAYYVYLSIITFYNLLYNCQAEPGADFFCREKRIENSGYQALVYALPFVRDLDYNALALDAGFYRYDAPDRHGVDGVG